MSAPYKRKRPLARPFFFAVPESGAPQRCLPGGTNDRRDHESSTPGDRRRGPDARRGMLADVIDDGWKLGCLAFTCDTANVPRMTDLVGPGK